MLEYLLDELNTNGDQFKFIMWKQWILENVFKIHVHELQMY